MGDAGLARLERAPTYRLVYDAIEREIAAGRLKIGDPLPTEMELADQFAVNRSTVREGIRLLEQSGLVTAASGRASRRRATATWPLPPAGRWSCMRSASASYGKPPC